GVGRFLPELAEVDFGTLVGAVLAPHDRVDGQLGGGGTAAEDLPDPRVLLVLHTEFGVGLREVRGGRGLGDSIEPGLFRHTGCFRSGSGADQRCGDGGGGTRWARSRPAVVPST